MHVLWELATSSEFEKTHRLVGFTSFTLMLAHIGLITIGYADGRLRGA